jgi:thioredoxin reductase (NADPH)
MLDLVIVGSGIAGITAAIYAKRAGIEQFKLMEKGLPGGQITVINTIDNFPGLPLGTTGADFIELMNRQLKELGIETDSHAIERLEQHDDGTYTLHTNDGLTFRTKTVIIATGASPRTLGISAEAAYAGKGVSYCAICDGFFFRNKTVAVVGGGNSALEEALYLSNIAAKVYLVHRRDQFRAFQYLVDDVRKNEKIELVLNKTVDDIAGEGRVESLVLKDAKTGLQSSVKVDGLFVAIGYEPATKVFKETVEADNEGFILVDGMMRTTKDGVFACGDCIKKELKQLVTSASEGAKAAIACFEYLKHGPKHHQ